jgi:acetolactate synthase-1/2/3 large subunit
VSDPSQCAVAVRPKVVASQLVELLWQLGVREAYGVCGREIVPVWAALLDTEGTEREIATRHVRHENGGGFAAVGSWLATGRPVAIFVTTAPGVTNVITSLETARATGARYILLSPLTPAVESGRLGIQDTGPSGYFNPDVYTAGRLFDVVAMLQSPAELPALAGRLAGGFVGHRPFAAHIAVPTTLQSAPANLELTVPAQRRTGLGVSAALADELVALLAEAPFAVWVGWGARGQAAKIRRLLDLTGAPVMSSPRGIGTADRHRQFIGVTGNGGSESLADELARYAPQRTLVLGTALGEATSGWLPELVPPAGFIHVDIDDRVFAHAYPQAPTVGVQAEVGEVLDALLARQERLVRRPLLASRHRAPAVSDVPSGGSPVHPVSLMAAIQRIIVDQTEIPVIADASSAMFWATRHLVFREPGRWFVEGRFGSMGSAGAIVVGAASARRGPALALVGDGSMHMQDEINTAVRYKIPAIWVVLNDSGLGIVRAGMRANGRPNHDASYPDTDFAAVALAKGAAAVRVTRQDQLDDALQAAVLAGGPFLVDVVIDQSAAPPIGARARR